LENVNKRQKIEQSGEIRESDSGQKPIFEIGSSSDDELETGKFGKTDEEIPGPSPFDPPVYGFEPSPFDPPVYESSPFDPPCYLSEESPFAPPTYGVSDHD
jgi:hypothetical protein